MAARLIKSCALLLLLSSAAYAEKLTVIGDAYALGGETLLYREYHYYSEDGMDHRVVYIAPDNSKIAEKSLNYRPGKSTPEVNHQAWLYPEKIQIAWDSDQLALAYTDNDAEQKTATLDANWPLVIDAGFDNYVRENWPSLLTGASLEFYFPAPTRMSLVNLMIKQKLCAAERQNDVCFSVNSSNWFIRLLLDPIELSYDKDTQQLSRFRGLGNMMDKEGNGLKVDIRYRYQGLCVDEALCAPLLSEATPQ
ncbi:hypothetical protein [Oceanicoccus sagamiensis]|uniref:Uncharacterized protein n=1 Tax=Oceanicoccus sagamiensis TaxID=716816 RepID=A0A1X9NHG0_9GAMM|nr:hypothetical protein [Oceanicoccus sagamiensis]ARN73423.1 hypothetical protein BST96_04425 [Oceanicoccus sagamiensis]